MVVWVELSTVGGSVVVVVLTAGVGDGAGVEVVRLMIESSRVWLQLLSLYSKSMVQSL